MDRAGCSPGFRGTILLGRCGTKHEDRSATKADVIKRFLDPHVHASASSCSILSDKKLFAWFDAHPEFLPCVSDHMTWEFYKTDWARTRARAGDILFGTEITLGGVYDFVLLTHDLAAFAESGCPAAGKGTASPAAAGFGSLDGHLQLFADPRVLVTFAHPPLWSARRGSSWRDWLRQVPVDFLEYNAIRLLPSSFSLRKGGGLGRAGNVDPGLLDDNEQLLELRDGLFPHARFIVGSDSHQPDRLGTTYIEFEAPVAGGREAWERLREGAFRGRLDLDGLGSFRIYPDSGLAVA